jgi:hypothetical protein
VANSGDLAGTYKVTLKIDGTEIATETLNLAGRTKDMVTFDSVQDVPGVHTVEINGLSRKITVRSRAPAKPPQANTALWIVIGLSAFMFSLSATLTIGWKKMKSGAPSDSPSD